jgi:putative transposon-encoded protein
MVVKEIRDFKVVIEAKVHRSGNGAIIIVPREFLGKKVKATIEIID